jgi:hypothetical protein
MTVAARSLLTVELTLGTVGLVVEFFLQLRMISAITAL